jgi:hypothetical protein
MFGKGHDRGMKGDNMKAYKRHGGADMIPVGIAITLLLSGLGGYLYTTFGGDMKKWTRRPGKDDSCHKKENALQVFLLRESDLSHGTAHDGSGDLQLFGPEAFSRPESSQTA